MCSAHLSVSLQVLVRTRGFATFVTFILSREGRGVQNSQQLLQVNNCYNYQQWWIEQICTETRKGLFFGSVEKRWLFCCKALVVLCHCVIWFWWRQHTWNNNGKSQPLWNIYIYMYNCGKICLFDRADICWVLSKKCYLHQTIDWCGQYSFKSHQVGSPMETSIVHTCESFLCPNFPCLVGSDTALCK